MHEVIRCYIPDCSVIQQSDLVYERTLRYYLSKLISLWGASKSSYVVYNFTHTIQGDFFCVCQTYGARKGCHLLWVGKHNKNTINDLTENEIGSTAKRKLERRQFSTSSSCVKIWSACSCEFKAYFWTFWAL